MLNNDASPRIAWKGNPKPRRVRHVAVMVSSVVAPRRLMLNGIARYMQEHEPWAISLPLLGARSALEKWLGKWQGDGIIGLSVEPVGAAMQLIEERRIPVVDVVGYFQHPKIPLVHANDHAVGRLGAEHLMERGFAHFGFCEYKGYFWSARRREAFEASLRQNGFTCSVLQTSPQGWTERDPEVWERQHDELNQWLNALPKPAGVMATNDLMGQQLLEACLRVGIQVPDEVAVVGADNDEPICRISYPPLSSVMINDHQRGYEAAAILDRLMKGDPPPPSGTVVQVEPMGVATRASSDTMAVDDPVVVAALRFLRERACEPVTVADVVDYTSLSRTTLEQRFRRVVGRSINNELTRLRISKAIELLSDTSLGLKTIALRAGFRSQSYMNAVFRAKIGKTPGSFRRTRSGAKELAAAIHA